MYVPITSEVTIETGMALREVSTDQIFFIAERIKNGPDVAGEDQWRIVPSDPQSYARSPLVLTRQELSEKYFAQV